MHACIHVVSDELAVAGGRQGCPGCLFDDPAAAGGGSGVGAAVGFRHLGRSHMALLVAHQLQVWGRMLGTGAVTQQLQVQLL
jgi:hypothetical protein